MTVLRIFTDANPTHGAYLVEGEQPKLLTFSESLSAPYSELEAILECLKAQEDESEIELLNDNEVAIKILNLEYGIHKDKLRDKCFEIWNLITAKRLRIVFKWVSGKENKAGKILG